MEEQREVGSNWWLLPVFCSSRFPPIFDSCFFIVKINWDHASALNNPHWGWGNGWRFPAAVLESHVYANWRGAYLCTCSCLTHLHSRGLPGHYYKAQQSSVKLQLPTSSSSPRACGGAGLTLGCVPRDFLPDVRLLHLLFLLVKA